MTLFIFGLAGRLVFLRGWYNIGLVIECGVTVCGYCARVGVVSVGLGAFRGLATFWFSVSGL